MFKLSLVLSLVCLAAAKHEQYEGHSLYNVFIKFADQIEILKDLEARYNLDVWSYAVADRPGVILVPGGLKEIFQQELQEAGIDFEVSVENVKEMMDLEDSMLAASAAVSRSNRSRSVTEGLSYDVIHPFEVVDQYLDDLAMAYPETVTVVTAGRSIEGRDIKYLRISTTNFTDTTKPVVMVQSLLHAREWVTLPATLYAIHKLVINVTDEDVLQNVDWIIMPVANPDGYVFSHTANRFWRKNRAAGFMPGDICMGVDLNRNFDIFWGTASSANVCMETYHGRGPFSEPETAAIRDILALYGNRLEMYLDMHSFGSMILYGYGNGELPPNALAKNLLAVRMAQAIDAVKWPQHRNYIVGNVALVLYQVSGGSTDYASAIGVPYSYTFELPSFNNIVGTVQGFLVDPAFIEQAGFETWEAIKVAGRMAASIWNRSARQ